MSSRFRMQIIDTTSGRVVEYEPGLTVETDFIADCVERIVAKGVGILRTSNHVSRDVEDGITEAIYNLKSKIKPVF